MIINIKFYAANNNRNHLFVINRKDHALKNLPVWRKFGMKKFSLKAGRDENETHEIFLL